MRSIVLCFLTLVLGGCGAADPPVRPVDPAGPRFADVRLATGVRLRWAEQGSPDGQPVILLHGLTDSWYSYSRVLALLPARYHVYVLDQRGHGGSERPAGGYAMDDFAADLLAFMDAVGLERAAVVGHSMGSFVARSAAAAAPERITHLVLIGSAADPRTPALASFQQQVEALDDPVPAAFARDFQLSTIHRPVAPEFLDGVVAASRQVPSRVWRAALAGLLSHADLGRLERLPMPTLLLSGEQDAIWSPAQQDSLRTRIARATLKVYRDTGHAPHWERPAEFVRDLDAFLSAPS